jgi:hypothetical protein
MDAIEVRIDDTLRLASALLAASEWPDLEQKAKPYKPHRVADGARKFFAPQRKHPAVRAAQALVGAGEGLNAFFEHALNADWSGDFGAHLADFKSKTQPEIFWTETEADWQAAESQARWVLEKSGLWQFLRDLFGPQARQLVFVPNLLFPGLQTVTVSSATDLIVYAPPPKAWGTSPPWGYAERPDEVLATTSEALARFIFENNLPADQLSFKPLQETFGLAAAVLFLREAEGAAASEQLMMMEKKTRRLGNLPAAVSAIELILTDRRHGKYGDLTDYLPLMVRPV